MVLNGAYGVFSIQQFYGIGSEGEIRQGKNLADAARAANVLARATGQPHRFVEMPLEALQTVNVEGAIMFEWFQKGGYDADIPAVKTIYPSLMSFETWVETMFVPHKGTAANK